MQPAERRADSVAVPRIRRGDRRTVDARDELPVEVLDLAALGVHLVAVRPQSFAHVVEGACQLPDLVPAIQAARARHLELAALREEADSLAEALATRKLVERAKGLLMEREGLTEQEAFGRLRRASQVSGRPMRVVAEALIATFEDI